MFLIILFVLLIRGVSTGSAHPGRPVSHSRHTPGENCSRTRTSRCQYLHVLLSFHLYAFLMISVQFVCFGISFVRHDLQSTYVTLHISYALRACIFKEVWFLFLFVLLMYFFHPPLPSFVTLIPQFLQSYTYYSTFCIFYPQILHFFD